MKRRPLRFITRQQEAELINRLITLVDCSKFHPENTAIIMASPDYSATVAMHLSHAWSVGGEIIPIIPIDVAYPDEDIAPYVEKFRHDFSWHQGRYQNIVCVEAGIIRGGNWDWLCRTLGEFNITRENITLVALLENLHSTVKSDYVAEYFDNDAEELMFYFERYNKHWPIY